jgi:hypothetical protein
MGSERAAERKRCTGPDPAVKPPFALARLTKKTLELPTT